MSENSEKTQIKAYIAVQDDLLAIKFCYNSITKIWSYKLKIGNRTHAEIRCATLALAAITDKTIKTTIYTDSKYILSLIAKNKTGRWVKPSKTGPIELFRQLISNYKDLEFLIGELDEISILKKNMSKGVK